MAAILKRYTFFNISFANIHNMTSSINGVIFILKFLCERGFLPMGEKDRWVLSALRSNNIRIPPPPKHHHHHRSCPHQRNHQHPNTTTNTITTTTTIINNNNSTNANTPPPTTTATATSAATTAKCKGFTRQQ